MIKKTTHSLFRLRSIAMTETFFAIGALLVINMIFFNGDRYTGVNPHPFWFVIILISAQYGVTEGVFAVLVATFVFLIGNVRPRGDGEYLYSYLLDINEQPLLWLLSAVIIGSLRYRHVLERDRLRKELADAFQREDIVAVHYEQLRVIKETLEQRLVKQVHTTVDTYKAAKLMETSHPGKILEGVQDLVKSLLSPKKFSVFMLDGDALKLSMKYAWESTDEFTSVIPSTYRLFEEIIGKKRIVCVADTEDEIILADQGMLAGPIMSETGQILGMLKIEDINYTDLHISTLETFQIVCTWIGNAYFQAQNYQLASSKSFVTPENNLFSYEFFKLQADYTTFLAKRFNFDLSLVVVKLLNTTDMTAENHKMAMQSLETIVANNLRKIDQIFNYRMTDNTYYILLPGTPESNTRVVTDKISNVFDSAQKTAATHLELSFAVQTLYNKQQS